MSEEKNNLPSALNVPPEQLTEGAIKAYFNTFLFRKEYQSVLQNLECIKPTKDNLPECMQSIKQVRAIIKKLLEVAKDSGDPYRLAHKAILKCMNDLLEPISAKVEAIETEIKIKNDELLSDLSKANAEKDRIDGIKSQMATFINNCTSFITTATNTTQIVNLQKRIGTEKSRPFYAEFKDDFKEKCDALDELINERKLIIKKREELDKAEKEALKSGDDEKAASIMEEKEQLESDDEENILRLQEKAFDQVSNDIPVYVPEPAGDALKGRNYWRWEVNDVKKLFKKHPDLVDLVPNKEAIDSYVAGRRNEWRKDGKDEVEMDGIKFFIKKIL